MSTVSSGTKDLKQILGFWDLMALAVGQIIGSGIMVYSVTALSMTGRAVNVSIMISAFFTIMAAVPTIFVSSTVRMRGGQYTQATTLNGLWFGGFWQFIRLFQSVSQSVFAIGMASYLAYVIKGLNQTITALVLMLVFYVLNFFGTEWMSKAQNIMFYLLVAALVLFCFFGLPKVQWKGYFGNELFGQPFITQGFTGLMVSAAFLTKATNGGTVILNYSADAKNPKKDFPIVIIISTVTVAFLYFGLSTVIGGVLPPEEVIAAGNLAPIAEAIMPKVCYWFFMVAGAGFALGTTLNSSIASSMRPMLQACIDGWFPRALAVLHPKFKSPYRLLLLYGIINTVPIILGMSVKKIGNLTLFLTAINNFIMFWGVTRLPKVFPKQWEKSTYHCSQTALYFWMIPCMGLQAYQAYLNAISAGATIVIANLVILAMAGIFSVVMIKSGRVKMEVSYSDE